VDVVQSETRSKIIGKISRIAGPVVVAKGMTGAKMYEVVRVGIAELIGEIIRVEGDTATIRGSANERIRWEQIRRPAPSPRVFNPDVPLTVARQVRIALSKKPSARHASAMQFFQSLLVPGVVTIDYDWHWEALERRPGDERPEDAETPST